MNKAFALLRGGMAATLLIGAACAAAARAEPVCRPSSLGSPCASGGIATQADLEPGLNLGAGNPIHIVTGNKYQHERDLLPFLHSPLLEISRHYNALDRRPSVLGQGWALAYDTRLHVFADRWQIVQADGSRIVFSGAGKNQRSNRHGTVQRNAAQWLWTWPDGRQLVFDSDGRLARLAMRPPSALAITLHRHDEPGPLLGAIRAIVDGNGHTLAFHYSIHQQRAYLDRIATPAGTFRYHYESADPASPGPLRLLAVTRPDTMQRRYLYEAQRQGGNPFHLTGIEIAPAEGKPALRLNTWAYDPQGRAVLSIQGAPDSGANEIHIDYVRTPDGERSGLTIVRDAHNRETRFRTSLQGGRHVLLEAGGDGCPGCAAPGSAGRYDIHGRLIHINGMAIRRHASGRIRQLAPVAPGWPGLALDYNQEGLRTSWRSMPTGTERTIYDAQRRPLRRLFGNGGHWDYSYDAAGSLASVVAVGAAQRQNMPPRCAAMQLAAPQGDAFCLGAAQRQKTTLSRPEAGVLRIGHPHETETRRYDSRQRLVSRTVQRPTLATPHHERFEYDAQNRLIRHHLPEGGRLSYLWGPQQRLLGITWQDTQGRRHTVVQSHPSQPGYQYGNGLRLHATLHQGQARQLVLRNEQGGLLWLQRQDYDQNHRVSLETHYTPAAGYAETWSYAYDAASRLAGAQGAHRRLRPGGAPPPVPDPGPSGGQAGASGTTHWYAWNDDGSLAARRTDGTSYRPKAEYDRSGLPARLDGHVTYYGPNRRLSAVEQNGAVLASYAHNAFGHRVHKRTSAELIDYFYAEGRLVAEARRPANAAAAAGITRRYIYAHHVPVGLVVYTPQAPQGTLYAIHADLLGAPRLLTGQDQKVRWFARYSPTGEAQRLAGDMTLDLRLPGQVFDAETGWHDNLLRTYLPASGHYLEPDPLGPAPGSQARGYANQQPRRYVDPLGLLLFAFDGTRNTPQSQTNIWKMSQRYLDGQVFYHAGPGNAAASYPDWDSITAYSASRILDAQWSNLLAALDGEPFDPAQTIPIDIIGFSRGAALARHFGNLVDNHVADGLFSYQDERLGLVTACVDLRFMGLFDTVAQFGLGGIRNADYDLSIASSWGWVAHAVALQEHRRYFPLSSVQGGEGLNTIEAPFIGAHADIGGGAAHTEDATSGGLQGDLSDVALNWMLWQARSMALRFDAGPAEQSEITHPVVHDQRTTGTRPQGGDRRVDAADGTLLHGSQAEHPRLGQSQRLATEPLIDRYEGWQVSTSNEVGIVDMSGYALWLQNELGWRDLPA